MPNFFKRPSAGTVICALIVAAVAGGVLLAASIDELNIILGINP